MPDIDVRPEPGGYVRLVFDHRETDNRLRGRQTIILTEAEAQQLLLDIVAYVDVPPEPDPGTGLGDLHE